MDKRAEDAESSKGGETVSSEKPAPEHRQKPSLIRKIEEMINRHRSKGDVTDGPLRAQTEGRLAGDQDNERKRR